MAEMVLPLGSSPNPAPMGSFHFLPLQTSNIPGELYPDI